MSAVPWSMSSGGCAKAPTSAVWSTAVSIWQPLGAGSTVLGNIVVGDGATVGSQAVCTRAVPPGMTVVGLNKLLDPNKDAEVKEVAKKRQETWQYELGVGGYGSYGGTGVQNWDI